MTNLQCTTDPSGNAVIELKADGAYIDGERVERELTATIARDCSLKPDNSIDGITCESLLADIERAAAEPGVCLDGTTKALWVILRRLVAPGQGSAAESEHDSNKTSTRQMSSVED